MSRTSLFDITCILVRETDKAVCIDAEGDGETLVWLPKSQIEIAKVAGKQNLYEVTMPEWLAEEKDLL